MRTPPRIPPIFTRLLVAGLVGIALLVPVWRLYQRHRVQSAVAAGSAEVADLTAALEYGEPALRRRAADGLGRKGPEAAAAVPALVEALEDPETHAQASEALVRIGAPAVPALNAKLQDRSPAQRRQAARLLARMGPPAQAAVPALLQALKDADAEVRWRAAEALGAVGPPQEPATAPLNDALKDANPRVRQEAAQALGRLAPGPDAVPALIDLLDDSSQRIVRAAAVALGRVGPPAEPAVPALIEVLKGSPGGDDSPNHWLYAPVAEALGRIGPAALRPLLAALAPEDPEARGRFNPGRRLRPWAGHAVRHMDRAGAVPLLVEALKDPSARKREEAAWLVGEIGPEARPAVPLLREALKADGPEPEGVRRAAAEALGKIDPEAAKLVDRVQSLFDKLVLREEVLDALRQDATLGPDDRELALQLAQGYRQDPNQLNDVSWQVVRAREAGPEAYALALRQAAAAVRLAPKDGNILNTLGVAQYRAGRYAEAVTTLTQSDQINTVSYVGSIPADLAFLAMAQHRLDQKEQARESLARLREAMRQRRWATDEESQAFLREAEELLQDKR